MVCHETYKDNKTGYADEIEKLDNKKIIKKSDKTAVQLVNRVNVEIKKYNRS